MSVRTEILRQLHELQQADMYPKAIYIDPESYAELMHMCSIGEILPVGTFQSIPLFSVQDRAGPIGRHVVVHGDRT